MIVSWNWLSQYTELAMPLEELTDRLTLTGLNLEGVEGVLPAAGGAKDWAIDLEVTSNRPDCLGHLGVAREVSVIWQQPLTKPDPQPPATGEPLSGVTSVGIECPELCPRYTARVIRGVKIGPSPDWLAERLRSIGVAVINNVVDATNFVMMECGQPLHAFDFGELRGGRIIVRRAAAGEEFTAIDHKTYTLTGDEVVIADAQRPVALGGVMGGFDTEVSGATVDVLIESADFAPLAVRGAARSHNLHSPSSYRFERGVDPAGIDWASRRCCELILQTAGGELCGGVIDTGPAAGGEIKPPAEIKLRFNQIPRLLGIDVPADQASKILTDLGCEQTHICGECLKVIPPSWRADLTREADLLEEVARIYGYDRIPEDTGVSMAPSRRGRAEVVTERVQQVMTAAGFDEAVTLSAVEPEQVAAFRPWSGSGGAPPTLVTGTSVLRNANALRQSLVPSLLVCRRTNEALSNPTIELFEIASVYLPREGQLPDERRVLAATSGGGFLEVKGVVEALVAAIAPGATLRVEEARHELLDAARSCTLRLAGPGPHGDGDGDADGDAPLLGVLGELSGAGRQRFDLRGPSTVFEIDLAPLTAAARLVRTARPLSSYQPVSRDLNIVVDEAVRWSAIEAITRTQAGGLLEGVTFQDDSYRDPGQLGEGKKSVLFSIQLRKSDGTLTGEEADAVSDRIVQALGAELGGKLRG
ncbi:MAG: phenylalanine--tRNA ligase subunit beta [Planctomycetota bacterium]